MFVGEALEVNTWNALSYSARVGSSLPRDDMEMPAKDKHVSLFGQFLSYE